MCWCGDGQETTNTPPSRPMKLSLQARSRPPSRRRFGARGNPTAASSLRGSPRRTVVGRLIDFRDMAVRPGAGVPAASAPWLCGVASGLALGPSLLGQGRLAPCGGL
jgi:hypothetical protein